MQIFTVPSKRQRSVSGPLKTSKAQKPRKARGPNSGAARSELEIRDNLKVQDGDKSRNITETSNDIGLSNEQHPPVPEANVERPVMWPALIRVYEDRMVRVTILRREISNSLPSASSSVTARVVALSAILASAAALTPMCDCMTSGSSKMPSGFLIPYSHGKPLHFGTSSHSSRGYAWIKSAIARDQSIPFVTAAAAAAADVVFYRAILSLQK